MLGWKCGVAAWLSFGGILLGSQAVSQSILDAKIERQKAIDCERDADWKSALSHWERVLDRCEASPAEREEAIGRVREIRPKLPGLENEVKESSAWRAVMLVFEELEFVAGKGTPGERVYRSKITDEEFRKIEASIEAFRAQVFRSSSGRVSLVPEIVRIETPLAQLAGDAMGGLWLDPLGALPFAPKQTGMNPYESVFTYVKMNDGKGNHFPVPFWGGTYGGDSGIHGAGYTAICWNPDSKPDGELEFHEWMHQVDWMFAAVLGYPDDFVPNPDSGKRVGESGGDPCYRRKPQEEGWLGFFRHIAEEHITRQMWSEAGMFAAPSSPIRPNDIRRWLVLGPFLQKEGEAALLYPFIEEDKTSPKAGQTSEGKVWKLVEHEDRVLDFGKQFGFEGGKIAYAFVRVRSPQPREAKLLLGSDDGALVWMNGKLVHSVDRPRVLQHDLDRVPVKLEKGWNRLLVKVDNRGGGWFLQARLVDIEGRALRDLEYAAD